MDFHSFLFDDLCSNYKRWQVQNKNTGCISITETVFTCSRSIVITPKVTRRAYRLIFYSSNTNHQKKSTCKPLNGKACLYGMYLTCILLCYLNMEPSFQYKCWWSLKNKVSPVCILWTVQLFETRSIYRCIHNSKTNGKKGSRKNIQFKT